MGSLKILISLFQKLLDLLVRTTSIIKLKDIKIICQVVIDDKKMFIDLFVGMLKNVNDSNILKKIRLYFQVHCHGFFCKERADVT